MSRSWFNMTAPTRGNWFRRSSSTNGRTIAISNISCLPGTRTRVEPPCECSAMVAPTRSSAITAAGLIRIAVRSLSRAMATSASEKSTTSRVAQDSPADRTRLRVRRFENESDLRNPASGIPRGCCGAWTSFRDAHPDSRVLAWSGSPALRSELARHRNSDYATGSDYACVRRRCTFRSAHLSRDCEP
jgi:hypothetical protein